MRYVIHDRHSARGGAREQEDVSESDERTRARRAAHSARRHEESSRRTTTAIRRDEADGSVWKELFVMMNRPWWMENSRRLECVCFFC